MPSVLEQKFVFDAINAEKQGKQFPINFDDVWQSLGYSTKGNAVRVLVADLTEDQDFRVFIRIDKNSEGRPSKDYILSIDGFKAFCLMARTDEGQKVRQYFIEAEKQYRATLERQFAAPTTVPQIDLSDLYRQMAELSDLVKFQKDQIDALQSDRSEAHNTKQLKLFKPDIENISLPLVAANEVIGYASLDYLKQILRKDFVADVDYRKSPLNEWFITEACFHELVIVARPQRGAMTDKLPEWFLVQRDRMYRVQLEAANTRFGKVSE